MRRSRLAALVAVALSASACSRPATSRTGGLDPVTLPIVASSMSSVYGIQLDLRGSAVVRDGWVYVEIPSGAARTYQGRANAWDLVVRAGIATCDGRGSRLIAEGRAARVAPVVGLTLDHSELDTVTRQFSAPLSLAVGIPPGTDLGRSWVTIEVTWPVESVIATYSLPATGGLVAGEPASVAEEAGRARGNGAKGGRYSLESLGTRTPPTRVRCR